MHFHFILAILLKIGDFVNGKVKNLVVQTKKGTAEIN